MARLRNLLSLAIAAAITNACNAPAHVGDADPKGETPPSNVHYDDNGSQY